MARGMFYNDQAEAQMKCQCCVFAELDTDDLVYVREVQGTGKKMSVLCSPVGGLDKMKEVSLSSIQFEPISLGFIQTDRHAVFLSRIPRRRSRQGLEEGNVSQVMFPNYSQYTSKYSMPRWSTTLEKLWMQEMHHCIYPAIKGAISVLTTKKSAWPTISVAISPSFAVAAINNLDKLAEACVNSAEAIGAAYKVKDLVLVYKFYGEVGKVLDDGQVVFDPKYAALKDVFEEEMACVK